MASDGIGPDTATKYVLPQQKELGDPNSAPPNQVHLRDLSEFQRKLQTRYWNITRDTDLARCSMCSGLGHMSETCTARDCAACGLSNAHFQSACPQRLPCPRCREPGHQASTCTSKLPCTAQDGLNCLYCQGNHIERDCSWLWRTFDVSRIGQDRLLKVGQLPISCYRCGSSNHLGDECNVPNLSRQSVNDIFSARFANNFLSKPIKLELSVLGRASKPHEPPTGEPIHASSSFKMSKIRGLSKARARAAANTSASSSRYRAVPPPHSLSARGSTSSRGRISQRRARSSRVSRLTSASTRQNPHQAQPTADRPPFPRRRGK